MATSASRPCSKPDSQFHGNRRRRLPALSPESRCSTPPMPVHYRLRLPVIHLPLFDVTKNEAA